MPSPRRKYLSRRTRLIHRAMARPRVVVAPPPPAPDHCEAERFQTAYTLAAKQLEKAAAEVKRLRGLESERQHEAEQLRGDVEALKTRAREEVARAQAELENARKRMARDREDMKRLATSEVLNRVIQPVDHFEFALKSLTGATDVASLREGIELIHRELMGALQLCGLDTIIPLGQTFDPNFHEAVATSSDPSRAPQEIVEVIRPGYLVEGRVLRAAMVRVNTIERTPTPVVAPIAEPTHT